MPFWKTDYVWNKQKSISPEGAKYKTTRIKAISDKKKARIKETGGENKMFTEIWLERPHICSVCGKPIRIMHSSCFAHIKSKGMYPELRMDKNNIALVHGIWEIREDGQTYNCHKELDTLNAKNNKGKET